MTIESKDAPTLGAVETGGLLKNAYVHVMYDSGDKAANGSLEANELNKLLFPHMPDEISFSRDANFTETLTPGFTEPLLVFQHNSPLELTLSLDYVAGIHLEDPKQLMKYASCWQALPLMRRNPSEANGKIVAPPPVIMRISNWFKERGVIKSSTVTFKEPWTWGNFSNASIPSSYRSKTGAGLPSFNNMNVFPIGMTVTFTFLVSRLYSVVEAIKVKSGTKIQLMQSASSKENRRADMQHYRDDLLFPAGSSESSYKGFYFNEKSSTRLSAIQ